MILMDFFNNHIEEAATLAKLNFEEERVCALLASRRRNRLQV